MAPRGAKMGPRRPQDGPKTTARGPQRLPRGLQDPPRRPQETPRRPQEDPRGSQEASKTLPGGPKKIPRGSQEAFRVGGVAYSTHAHNYKVACNVSPLGRRRGPALRASIRRRSPAVSDYGRRQGELSRSALILMGILTLGGPTPFRRPRWSEMPPGS